MTTPVIARADALNVHVMTDRALPTMLTVLLLLVYAQGYIERMGVPPHLVKIALEMPIFLIIVHLTNRGVHRFPPGSVLVALYVLWTVVAAIYHGDGMLAALLYCRYVIYAYVVFAAVWSTPLTETAIAILNTTVTLLFMIQIVASAHEVFVRGERIEAHVGALYAKGGALATEFPLLAMGLTVPFYLYYRRNPLFLVLSWAFSLVGYASGKRAMYFLGPFLYVLIFGWYLVRERSSESVKRAVGGGLIFVSLIPVLLVGVSKSHGISDSRSEGLLDRVAYALDAALEYTTAEKQAGRTTGRTSTGRRVLSSIWNEEAETIVFGWGPAAMRDGEAQRYEALMITYGICGWARDVICIGWPGMLIYFLFHLRMFIYLRSCAPPRHSPYWMAIRFGAEIAFLVMLMSHIAYSSSVATGGQLGYVYFYVLALLTSPQQRQAVQSGSQPDHRNYRSTF